MKSVALEEWRDIPGYEGMYQISSFGRVKSLSRKIVKDFIDGRHAEHISQEIILSPCSARGYKRVILHKNGEGRRFLVHRLVAEAFVDNPNCEKIVNHLDGNKTNNVPENLEWCDYSRNMQHAFDEGIRGKHENHPRSKFTNAQVLEIRKRRREHGITSTQIAKEYGMSTTNAKDIINGKTWKGLEI